MKLAIVSAYFNPSDYDRTAENFDRFDESLDCEDERFFVEAVCFDDDAVDVRLALNTRVHHLQRSTQTLWHKEALLNLAIRSLPREYDAVAWLDADIAFADPTWIQHAERALDQYPVIQLFDRCLYLGPTGIVDRERWSVASQQRRSGDHCWGLAWAARRDVLEDGLLDWNVTGGADAMMADAWLGWSAQRQMHYEMERVYRPWAAKQIKHTGGRVACLHQSITHFYHGPLKKRKYGWRTRLLIDSGFDPQADIERDGELYKWTDHNPALRETVQDWLLSNPYEPKAKIA